MPVDGHAMPKTWAFQDASGVHPQRMAEERLTPQASATAMQDTAEV